MNKKYFFFDIDGTLTQGAPGSYVSDKTKSTLRELESKGHFVAIATGRAHFLAMQIAREVGIKNLVCEGGNSLVLNNELLSYEPLELDFCIRIIEEAEKAGFGYALSMDDTRISHTHNNKFIDQAGTFEIFMTINVDSRFDYHNIKEIRRIYISIAPEQEYLLPDLSKHGAMRYGPKFIIIEPSDKFKGIAKLMNKLEAPIEDVVVFGDGMNDIRMFKDAPFSIAMGNAIPELKELANYVTKRNDEEGILYACKHFNWL
ncbi:MAG: HAD family hydrolase [Erysipelotrichaceae bacterium]